MSKFIKQCILFLSFLSIIAAFALFAFLKINQLSLSDFPALHFSNSYSLNEKIRFLKTSSKQANTLALGSSMTLNNLHSETVINKFKKNEYLNTAAWGLSMGDNYTYLKSLNKVYPLKHLIICSNIVDFQNNEKLIDFNYVESYLKDNDIISFIQFFNTFDIKYYTENWRYAKKVRSCSNHYDYLNFDQYGAINFEAKGFKINPLRWESDNLSNNGLTAQYAYLDSISKFCANHNIQLYFFQSPIRQGLYNQLSEKKHTILKQHTAAINKMLDKNNQFLVNANEKTWPDSLFTDGSHLNKTGAKLFTQYCFDKINEIKD
jgi:hypothetical protein